MIDQDEELRRFFSPHHWTSYLRLFDKSGFALVSRVAELQPRFVVDAGCGYNEFKGKIRNLLGIDLVNPGADLVCDFNEAPIKANSIDVVLALGSINFGDEDNILRDLRAVTGWLTCGGTMFMRANPGEKLDERIVVFPWSRGKIISLGERVGLQLSTEISVEQISRPDGTRLTRLFWVYRKTP
jgi:hypothetical protein